MTETTDSVEYASFRESRIRVPGDLSNAWPMLDAVDREIGFYRRRSGQVYFFSLLVEALILVGRERILVPSAWTWETHVLHILFFVAVAVVGTLLGSEYRRRIHFLKGSREQLLEHLGYEGIYPTRDDQKRSEIKVLYFILWSLSVAGVIIVLFRWFGD